MGWFGETHHLRYVLGMAGAEKDDDGAFIIVGAPVCVGFGGCEVVIPDDAKCLINDQPVSIASLMNATSYGIRGITVIM